MTWTPDDVGPDERRTRRLTKAEQTWLTNQAETARSSPADARRLHAAAKRATEDLTWVVTGITTATVTIPPQQRRSLEHRRGSDPSDPSLAQITATLDAIDHACTRLGHLLDECADCDHELGITLAQLTGNDYTELSDHLTGIGGTSPRAIAKVVPEASAQIAVGVRLYVDLWHRARNSGAESDELRNRSGQLAGYASQVRRLADSLAQWTPSRTRRCKAADCNGAAPRRPDGERGGAFCDRCLKRQSRARQEGAA